ncbi:MAG: hypothetical protein GOU98_00155 [Candidatus Altiarchaeota archaeon]|nr:hypothetical protein [Candidatus Altiarchaeota archaeon]
MLIVIWALFIQPAITWMKSNSSVVTTLLLTIGIVFTMSLIIFWFVHKKRKEKRKEFVQTQINKGLVQYVDRNGVEIWEKPEKLKTIIDADQKAVDDGLLFTRVVNRIKRFEPFKKYDQEEKYQAGLAQWMKSEFSQTKIEYQRGSSRPDVIVDSIAIEIKGPTTSEGLRTIADKLLRYPQHFDHVVVVLFDLQTTPRYYDEWKFGISKKHPEVEIISK